MLYVSRIRLVRPLTNSQRDTRALNYTYPELAKWASLTPQDKSVRLRSDINVMYGKSAAFAAIVPDLFTLRPQLTTTSTTNMAAVGGKKATGRIAAPAAAAAAPAAKVATQPAGGAQPAQQPLAKQAVASASQAVSSIAGVAGVAAQKVAQVTPAPVASAANTVAGAAIIAAQKTAAVIPQSVTGAAQKAAATLGAPVAQPASTSGHKRRSLSHAMPEY